MDEKELYEVQITERNGDTEYTSPPVYVLGTAAQVDEYAEEKLRQFYRSDDDADLLDVPHAKLDENGLVWNEWADRYAYIEVQITDGFVVLDLDTYKTVPYEMVPSEDGSFRREAM